MGHLELFHQRIRSLNKSSEVSPPFLRTATFWVTTGIQKAQLRYLLREPALVTSTATSARKHELSFCVESTQAPVRLSRHQLQPLLLVDIVEDCAKLLRQHLLPIALQRVLFFRLNSVYRLILLSARDRDISKTRLVPPHKLRPNTASIDRHPAHSSAAVCPLKEQS